MAGTINDKISGKDDLVTVAKSLHGYLNVMLNFDFHNESPTSNQP